MKVITSELDEVSGGFGAYDIGVGFGQFGRSAFDLFVGMGKVYVPIL